jgi:hypothetical protein
MKVVKFLHITKLGFLVFVIFVHNGMASCSIESVQKKIRGQTWTADLMQDFPSLVISPA